VNREYHRWYSPALHRDMELLVLGHGGARALVFPTSMGRFFEWEDRGMHHVLGDLIEAGRLQLFCVDSVDAESWYARHKHPGERAGRHVQYQDYLSREVLPFTWERNQTRFLMAMGASLGAYHAVDFAFHQPYVFSRVIGLSGVYDIGQFVDGHLDDHVFAHNPSHYASHLRDPAHLDALRRMDIILVTGAEDPNVDNTRYLSRILWERGIGNALRIWDGWAHDWPYWESMIRRYVGGHD
jgi:esterase/lipase superfamily enzyme